MENNMNQMGGDKVVTGGKVCNCPHHKVVPWAIIIIGVAVLLNAVGILTYMATYIVAGLLLIVIGGTKLMGRTCGCCSKHS